MQGKEKALEVADENLSKTLNSFNGKVTAQMVLDRYKNVIVQPEVQDNVNSLPLEGGEYAFFPKLNHPGAYRRIRSDVTRIKNKPLTYK